MLRDLVGRDLKKVVTMGIGGGGDVVGGLSTHGLGLAEGVSSILGATLWERFVVDVVPGPIGIGDLVGARALGKHIALLNGESYAIRGGRVVKPQLANVLSVIGGEGLGISIAGAVEDVASELGDYLVREGVDAVFAIDVGGDSLGTGDEEGLASPLADSYTLAVLAKAMDKVGVSVVLGVLGPGVDGELSRDYVLARLSKVASRKGYLGAHGISRAGLKLMEAALRVAVSEASRLVYEAAKGLYGTYALRGGVRKSFVDISSTITYYVDLGKAVEELPLVKLIMASRSPWDAMARLNERCIYTELNFEEEVYSFYRANNRLPTGDEVASMVARLRENLRTRCLAKGLG